MVPALRSALLCAIVLITVLALTDAGAGGPTSHEGERRASVSRSGRRASVSGAHGAANGEKPSALEKILKKREEGAEEAERAEFRGVEPEKGEGKSEGKSEGKGEKKSDGDASEKKESKEGEEGKDGEPKKEEAAEPAEPTLLDNFKSEARDAALDETTSAAASDVINGLKDCVTGKATFPLVKEICGHVAVYLKKLAVKAQKKNMKLDLKAGSLSGSIGLLKPFASDSKAPTFELKLVRKAKDEGQLAVELALNGDAGYTVDVTTLYENLLKKSGVKENAAFSALLAVLRKLKISITLKKATVALWPPGIFIDAEAQAFDIKVGIQLALIVETDKQSRIPMIPKLVICLDVSNALVNKAMNSAVQTLLDDKTAEFGIEFAGSTLEFATAAVEEFEPWKNVFTAWKGNAKISPGFTITSKFKFNSKVQNPVIAFLAKHVPGELSLTAGFDGTSFRLTAALPDIKLGSPAIGAGGKELENKFTLKNIKLDFQGGVASAGLKVGFGCELQVICFQGREGWESKLTFGGEASVGLKTNGVEVGLKLYMKGMWNRAFGVRWLSIGDLQGRVGVTANQPFFSALGLEGTVAIGSGKNQIVGTAAFAVDIGEPMKSFITVIVKGRATVGGLIQAMKLDEPETPGHAAPAATGSKLPDSILKSGFPEGFKISAAIAGGRALSGDKYDAGITLKGKMELFDSWKAAADISIGYTKLDVKLECSPLALGPLTLYRAIDNHNDGPKLTALIQVLPPKVNFDAEVSVHSLLGPEFAGKFVLNGEELTVKGAVAVFGIAEAAVTVTAKDFWTLHSTAKFSVLARLRTLDTKKHLVERLNSFLDKTTRFLYKVDSALSTTDISIASECDTRCHKDCVSNSPMIGVKVLKFAQRTIESISKKDTTVQPHPRIMEYPTFRMLEEDASEEADAEQSILSDAEEHSWSELGPSAGRHALMKKVAAKAAFEQQTAASKKAAADKAAADQKTAALVVKQAAQAASLAPAQKQDLSQKLGAANVAIQAVAVEKVKAVELTAQRDLFEYKYDSLCKLHESVCKSTCKVASKVKHLALRGAHLATRYAASVTTTVAHKLQDILKAVLDSLDYDISFNGELSTKSAKLNVDIRFKLGDRVLSSAFEFDFLKYADKADKFLDEVWKRFKVWISGQFTEVKQAMLDSGEITQADQQLLG